MDSAGHKTTLIKFWSGTLFKSNILCVYKKEGLFAVLAFLAFVFEISLHLDDDFFERSGQGFLAFFSVLALSRDRLVNRSGSNDATLVHNSASNPMRSSESKDFSKPSSRDGVLAGPMNFPPPANSG